MGRYPVMPCPTTFIERGAKPQHNCHTGCAIKCSQVFNDAGKQYKTSGFEYESI
jgi:aldehyde:ferredoxin oxidoreductase